MTVPMFFFSEWCDRCRNIKRIESSVRLIHLLQWIFTHRFRPNQSNKIYGFYHIFDTMQSKKGLRINFETLKIVIEHHWTRKLIRTFKKGINWLKMFVCHFNWCLKRTCYVQNSRTPSLFYLNSSNQSKLKSKEMLCWGAFTCYAHICIVQLYRIFWRITQTRTWNI